MLKLPEMPKILASLLSEIGTQPLWRGPAAVDMAWRDNRQWTKEQIAYIESLGINAINVNLIAPAMDSVTGYEAKNRVDWMLTGVSEEHEQMGEAVNHELNDAMRMADANHACSEAYGSQAGVGIGWVEVRKNKDPLDPCKVSVDERHRNEMFWDMRSRSSSLRKDCRWVGRRKFYDKDAALAAIGPKYKDLIDFTFSDYQTIDISPESMQGSWLTSVNEYTAPIELIMDNQSDRPMVAIYQIYYKVFEKRDLIINDSGYNEEFNPKNPVQIEALSMGQAYVAKSIPITVCKVAWFVGPHLIYVGPSEEPHNHFPYVPFFGTKEDNNNCPVGLIRRMLGPQEQYNRAVVEIQRILRSRRIEKDHDALHKMTDEQAIFEINRTDGIVNLKNGRKFTVIREWEKLASLEGICTRAKEEVNAASGIYQTFQGNTEKNQSGIAVESIAELGAQSLGKINANYQLGRRLVGDLAFSHIVDDIGTSKKIISVPQEIGQNKKQVMMNDGVNNRISQLRAQVAMQDIHTSAGYRQHTHMRIGGIIEKIPDEFKGPLIPFWLESSEMPKKDQAVKLINKQLGYEQDEDKRAQQEEAQAQQAKEQRDLEIRLFVADIEEKEASGKQKTAQASNHTADAMKKRVETATLIKNLKMAGMPGSKPKPSLVSAKKPNSAPDQRTSSPPAASGANKNTVGSAAA